MLRTMRNIFILLLIGITASGMPIYASSINLNLTSLMPTIIPKENAITITSEEKKLSNNHFQITLGFSLNPKENYASLVFDETNPFTVELTSNGDTIKHISLDELVPLGNYKTLEIYSENPAYITFDFDQSKLNIPDGSYNLKLHPNTENKEFILDKTDFNINFSSEGIYANALATSKTGQTPLTLYFPDEELNYLVPVTRFVPYTSYPLTTILRNLENGPDSKLGLSNSSPIPSDGKAGKVGDTAYINLPANLGSYDQGSSIATMAVNSLINSITSADRISKVQFQFNGKVVNNAFHGMVMNEPYYNQNTDVIYVSYLSDTNRFLLVPVSFAQLGAVTENFDESIKIPTFFDVLKFKAIPGLYNSKVHPIVPNEVELLDYSLNEGVLTLTFNESFTKAYENNPQLRQRMVDGIIFTFLSLENVDSINIQLKLDSNGSNNQSIIIYDFQPPVYINPEI